MQVPAEILSGLIEEMLFYIPRTVGKMLGMSEMKKKKIKKRNFILT